MATLPFDAVKSMATVKLIWVLQSNKISVWNSLAYNFERKTVSQGQESLSTAIFQAIFKTVSL